MIERVITWQHAIRYGAEIKKLSNWQPLPITIINRPNSSVITLRAGIPVLKMRDWIYEAAGSDYEFNGIFGKEGSCLPSAFRFSFPDLETAVLCKLTWS